MASNSCTDISPVCIVCKEDEEKETLNHVTEQGKALWETMLKDNEELLQRLKNKWENNPQSVRYHKSCKLGVHNASKISSRKRENVNMLAKEEERKKKQRSCSVGKSKTPLLYKNKCILCNEPVKLYLKNATLARKTYSRPDNLTAADLKKRLIDTANTRLNRNSNDRWALDVKGRLLGINDLVAEEALLHKRCNSNFSCGGTQTPEGKIGRKRDNERLELFNEFCDWLDKQMEHRLFTLDQLHEKLFSLDKTPNKDLAYTKRYLKEKLLEIYEDQLYFTSQERRSNVLCFKDATATIIREHQENNEGDEKTKIIKSALKFIQNDIALANLDSDFYSSVNSMVDLGQHLELIPESLKLLLKPLLKDDKRVALWGQNIIRISRPRSGVLPLPMRYALQFDHRFGSKWLIDELHYHGFCESYNEVANYKYCYLRSTFKSRLESSNSCQTIVENIEEDENAVDEELQLSPDDHYLETETSNSQPRFSSLEYSGVQYVGDNIDLNIVSINGNTPFHAMGMIKIVNQSVALTDNYMNMKIPRLKLTAKEKAKILKAGDIPIQHCKDPKKSGINSHLFL